MITYLSTRNPDECVGSAQAIVNGLAPDGGLYVPSDISELSVDFREVISLDYEGMAKLIFGKFFPDFSEEEISEIVEKSYEGKFTDERITPLAPVGDAYVLELYHGPTCAFKDVALSALPNLMTASAKKIGFEDEILILTATSGDTGSAALCGFSDVPGTRIIVFYPDGGVSDTQRLQMVTQAAANTRVCAVRGNFDDAQSGVKSIFTSMPHPREGVSLSSANSINIGRLVPQVVYYFSAYKQLAEQSASSNDSEMPMAAGASSSDPEMPMAASASSSDPAKKFEIGDCVNFIVPTGNFGDIMAGYFAKEMGLPVGKLICASNKNDVLTEFLETGHYNRKREFYKTTSPSMDILVSSNLERLIYYVCGAENTKRYMSELAECGEYTISGSELAAIRETFVGVSCDDERGARAIGETFAGCGYLMDTHTSIAWSAYEELFGARPAADSGTAAQVDLAADSGTAAANVVLSTASPYKFCKSVLAALIESADKDSRNDILLAEMAADKLDKLSDEEMMRLLNRITGAEIPEPLAGIFERPVIHDDVIDVAEMPKYVSAPF